MAAADVGRLSIHSDKFTHKSSLVVCFGELLMDFVPTFSGVSLAEAPAFKKAPGGAPANVAVCIARLGGSYLLLASVDMLLQESELDADIVKKAIIFQYGSISLIEEPCRSAQLAAMKAAKISGSLLSYDPNLRLALWSSADAAREGIMSVWNQADIIKISENEITFLTGGDDPYNDDVVLNKLFHPNLRLLLVSEGSEGCRYYTKQFKGRESQV